MVEVDPNDIQEQPIIHESLSDELLIDIRRVFDMLREVVMYRSERMTLEQFEIQFMRSQDPVKELQVFEAIALAYRKACGCFPDNLSTKQTIYHWLILLVMGAVTEEEKEKPEVILISKCFASVYPSLVATNR